MLYKDRLNTTIKLEMISVIKKQPQMLEMTLLTIKAMLRI